MTSINKNIQKSPNHIFCWFFKYNKTIFTSCRFIIVLVTMFVSSHLMATNTRDGKTAQNSNFDCINKLYENIYLHINKNIAVAGDKLHLKAYLVGKSGVLGKSKILYIELVNDNNKIVKFVKSNVVNGITNFSVTLPDTLSTGMYRIIPYTNFMRNYPITAIPYSSILVIGLKDDLQQENKNIVLSPTNLYVSDSATYNNIYNSSNNNKIYFSATLNKLQFRPNEKVILSLTLKDKDYALKGNASVSVSEVYPEDYSNLNPDFETFLNLSGSTNNSPNHKYIEIAKASENYKLWLEEINKTGSQKLPFKPELIGFTMEGKIIPKPNSVIQKGTKILLSYPDSFAIIRYAFPDEHANFSFALPSDFDNKKLFFSTFPNESGQDYDISIENKALYDTVTKRQEIFKPNESLTHYLYYCKKIALLNKVYGIKQKEQEQSNNNTNAVGFYGQSYYVVKLTDYIEFDDFTDISKNVLPGVWFKKKKNKYSISLTDLDLHENWQSKCLVLLNNIPFSDLNYIATLGSKQIDRIEVLGKHIAYGDAEFYGLISIFMKDKTIIQDGHSMVVDNKFEPQETGPNQDTMYNASKIPNFKQALFWNPNVLINNNGTASVEFNTSELRTNYVVDIEGITSEGIPFSNKLVLKVK